MKVLEDFFDFLREDPAYYEGVIKYNKILKWIHFAPATSYKYILENGITINKSKEYTRKTGNGIYVIEQEDDKSLSELIINHILPYMTDKKEMLICKGEYDGEYFKSIDGEIVITQHYAIFPLTIKKVNVEDFLLENKNLINFKELYKRIDKRIKELEDL
ncbi:hypothetical protein FKF97_16490 [Clostridium perfringens]|nr:hypothetical protein [Clostridium perfringens]